MSEKQNTITVGELKRQLNLYADDCVVHFSSIGGAAPTFYRLKNWHIDPETNEVKEVVFEFNEL